MTPIVHTERRCPDCGDKIINPGAHAERCTGPRRELVSEECDCPPGAWHQPDCDVVVQPKGAA